MNFDKNKFQAGGGYVHYEGKFVARFKHCPQDKGPFLTFLRKNFTVEEYFEKTSGSGIECTPVKVLESKGWLAPRLKKMCRENGFEETVVGFQQMIRMQAEKY